MQQTKPIRDPVHDYIDLTPIEQAIIDRPEFQRLRFVLQNSTSYLTYPSNTHGRFLHSLGVMHVAGEMFCRALQNSNGAVLTAYLAAAKAEIEKHQRRITVSYDEVFDGWKTSLRDEARFNHRPLNGERTNITEEHLFIINTLWQVVRVEGLVHDIGHLPMSHVFEFAVGDLLKEMDDTEPFAQDFRNRKETFLREIRADAGPELADSVVDFETHEILGLCVFRTIFPSRNDDPGVEALQRLVNSLVKMVLLYPEPNLSGEQNVNFPGDEYGVLQSIHGIVAGDLDADRLDYCLRDPLKSGLELGAFDLRRIIDSFILHESDGSFSLLPTPKALSSIESFYHQRYLLYRYLYYHHNVVRMDGILKEILVRILKAATVDTEDDLCLRTRLRECGLWQVAPVTGDYHFMPNARFAHLDDSWLRAMLAEAYYLLSEAESELTSENVSLLLLLDTFLHGKSQNVVSMWKRESEYLQDIDFILEELSVETDKRKDIKQELGAIGGIFNYDASVADISKKLLSKDVMLIHRHLRPKTSKELRVLVNDEPCKLGELSPYCDSLREMAAATWLIHFSFVGEGLKRKDQTIKQCREVVLESLRGYIETLISDS